MHDPRLDDFIRARGRNPAPAGSHDAGARLWFWDPLPTRRAGGFRGHDWRKGAAPSLRGTDLPTPILSGRRRPAAAMCDDVRAARRVLRQAELGGSGDLAAPPLAPAARPTSREREVLALVAAGQTDKQIAAALSISPRTVSNHVASLLRKLGAETRAGAARRARRDGLMDPVGQETAPAGPLDPHSAQK